MKKHLSLSFLLHSPFTPLTLPLPFLLLVLLLAACGSNSTDSNDGTVEFRSPKGDIIVSRTIQGTDTTWEFNNALGEALVPGCDSLSVFTDTANGQPKEVIFHHKGQQSMLTFWSNMEKLAEGDLKNGQRNGLWTAYDMNTGKIQSETHFTDGIENGPYTVYNENGTPSITGQYTLGQRTGEWSFFDKEGNLLGTNQY